RKIKNNRFEKVLISSSPLLKSFAPAFNYTGVFSDHNKMIWLVNNDALMRVDYNGNMKKYFKLPSPLSSQFEDKEGNLWLVGQEILVLHHDKLYPVSIKNDSGKKIQPASVIVDKHGIAWLADLAEGINIANIKWNRDSVELQLVQTFTERDGLVNMRYAQLTYDETNDEVWAGSFWNGISRLSYRNNNLKTLHFNYSNGFPGERMLTVFFDEAGNLFCRSSAGL